MTESRTTLFTRINNLKYLWTELLDIDEDLATDIINAVTIATEDVIFDQNEFTWEGVITQLKKEL